jgi:hypothetical protein
MKQLLQIKLLYFPFAMAGVFLLWLFPASVLFAQTPVSFEARVSTPELVQGNQFEVHFELKEAEGVRFRPPDFKPFTVISGPNYLVSSTMVNGKFSSQLSWTYVLTANQTGAFTLGSASVVVGGKVLQTKPLNIRVLPSKGSKQNINIPPGAKEDLFIAASFDHTTVFPGQQLTYQIKLFTLISIEGADLIGLPDFKGFYFKEKRRFNTEIQYVTLRGKRYAVKTIYEAALFPQETGELTVGPARIRAGIEQMGALGVFMGPRPVLLQTQALSVKVNALPDPIPANFCGGVGAYAWEIKYDKDTLTTDEVLTVRASVRGDGDARKFAPPKLELPAGLEAFEPKTVEEEEYENGESLVHRKEIEYVIMPKTPGSYQFSPTLVSFNPESKQFQTNTAENPIVIVVLPGKNYAAQQVISDSLEHQAPVQEVQPGFWKKMGYWPWIIGFGVLLVGGLLFFMLLRRRKEHAVLAKPIVVEAPVLDRQGQLKGAKMHLVEASRLLHGEPRAFYDALFKGLTGYLSAKLDLNTAQLTHKAVQNSLMERQIPLTLIQHLHEVWQSCEQALFSGQPDATSKETLLREAESCIQLLDKALKR